ncbi:hypothetical protein SAMN05216600_10511 [Pseudomonas cuatrocienegasensis]|uniref:Uncharacterized protein n=1 Tax=Pseudomonas cuatrocienegasensis TaxID=543360 RepID=A0ABY1B9Q0_9PSED|nr:hypothetical protein SAMN05216600_10511 [Pseudomonas cuatrocienegasensis]
MHHLTARHLRNGAFAGIAVYLMIATPLLALSMGPV